MELAEHITRNMISIASLREGTLHISAWQLWYISVGAGGVARERTCSILTRWLNLYEVHIVLYFNVDHSSHTSHFLILALSWGSKYCPLTLIAKPTIAYASSLHSRLF